MVRLAAKIAVDLRVQLSLMIFCAGNKRSCIFVKSEL